MQWLFLLNIVIMGHHYHMEMHLIQNRNIVNDVYLKN
jgi:hypothetical protein